VPKYEARLPGVRIRCFINERTRARYELREIPMRLDTVWIDMDAETLILVWRGNVDVRNQKLIGSEHFFATSEPLGQPPLDRAACVERLEEALARREKADEELDAEMPEELGEEEEEEVEEEEEEEEEEKKKKCQTLHKSPTPRRLRLPTVRPMRRTLRSAEMPMLVLNRKNRASPTPTRKRRTKPT
jgi:hypothetical protein